MPKKELTPREKVLNSEIDEVFRNDTLGRTAILTGIYDNARTILGMPSASMKLAIESEEREGPLNNPLDERYRQDMLKFFRAFLRGRNRFTEYLDQEGYSSLYSE